MTIGAVALLAYVAARLAVASPPVPQSRDFGCTEWHQCRQLALAAADRGEYETFHDLAWRAVQTGPPKDPALMYLLARAQALSGRPHDALIMLQRLAEMGVPSDAATNDDFARTRQLPGWPDVSARIERAEASRFAAAAASQPRSPRPVPPRPGRRAAAIQLTVAPNAGRAPGSRPRVLRSADSRTTRCRSRFLFGDRLGRKLIVVGEGTNHTVDFVRADSAGFRDIAAMEIDDKRGDLWVVSAAPADGAGTLHKLQLVSGRPLKSFPIAADLEPSHPSILPSRLPALSSFSTPRAINCWFCVPGDGRRTRHEVDAAEPASLAAAEDEGIVYVAYRDGVSRVDLRARTATKVAAPKSVSLAHLERIRWRRQALIAIRVDADGTRRIVRLDLSANGRAVTKATKIDSPVLPAGGQTLVDHFRGRACLSGQR